MADSRISDLPVVLTLIGNELIEVVQGGANKQTTTQEIADLGGGSIVFIDKETPSGSINSSNVTFTLANTPISGSEHVFLNGILYESGGGNDYTISAATITFAVAPSTGDKMKVTYRQ